MHNNELYKNMRLSSMDLESARQKCSSDEEFIRKYGDELLDAPIGKYIEALAIKYNKTNAQIAKDAGLSRQTLGNIINCKRNEPSRNVILMICFGIGANLEEVQSLLKFAGQAPLYIRRERDIIIEAALKRGESLSQVNEALYHKGLEILETGR